MGNNLLPVLTDISDTLDRIEILIQPGIGPLLSAMQQMQLTMNAILSTLQNPPSGGGTLPGLALAGQQVVFNNVPVSGTQIAAPVTPVTVTIPAGATMMVLYANAAGQMTAVAGVMLDVRFTFAGGSAITAPIQTAYQGGQAELSGTTPTPVTVPAGAATVDVSALLTATTGTWTVSGGVTVLFQ